MPWIHGVLEIVRTPNGHPGAAELKILTHTARGEHDTTCGPPRTCGGQTPDPRENLRALVDRDLRSRLTAANLADADLPALNVQGTGHESWVDEAGGFTREDQGALLH